MKEDKIEVGEYIRNIYGEIYRVDDLDDTIFLEEKFYNRIIKHSKDIIDLIEVGDYVNGKEVIELAKIGKEIDWLDLNELLIDDSKDIKSIVTKEQFKSIEYRLED